ncbi:hypothetical protein DAI22_02g114650 [Oryza sativa Japonica Group]|nr:hypothetical protein DAI22_02g114650 [Oryza sativa Japonica Group]
MALPPSLAANAAGPRPPSSTASPACRLHSQRRRSTASVLYGVDAVHHLIACI